MICFVMITTLLLNFIQYFTALNFQNMQVEMYLSFGPKSSPPNIKFSHCLSCYLAGVTRHT